MRSTFGRFTSLAVVAATAIFVACDESPTSLDSQDQTLAVPSLAAGGPNPVVLSARGSGHSEGPGIGGTEVGWRTFTFNAVQRLDGTATGKMQYDTHDQGDAAVTHRQRGRVRCLATVDNPNDDIIVLIGLEGTQRVPEDQPTNGLDLPNPNRPNNHGMIFVVRDNGEGASASADEFSGVIHTILPVVDAACANPEILSPSPGQIPAWVVAESFFNDVEAGNIQVGP